MPATMGPSLNVFGGDDTDPTQGVVLDFRGRFFSSYNGRQIVAGFGPHLLFNETAEGLVDFLGFIIRLPAAIGSLVLGMIVRS